MDNRKDAMGMAIADFHKNGKADRLRVLSPDFEEDEIPVESLFRSFDEMPALEQTALTMSKGKILDVGAGAGCHSLALQAMEKDVTAVEISSLSSETMIDRGVKKVLNKDFFQIKGRYNTILMLMNGIGIVGKVKKLPSFFKHIDSLLEEDGQLLIDSSDISYVFEEEDGVIYLPEGPEYYGELEYKMIYKDVEGDSFQWLYIDFDTLKVIAQSCGFKAELIVEGEHYEYLARITR